MDFQIRYWAKQFWNYRILRGLLWPAAYHLQRPKFCVQPQISCNYIWDQSPVVQLTWSIAVGSDPSIQCVFFYNSFENMTGFLNGFWRDKFGGSTYTIYTSRDNLTTKHTFAKIVDTMFMKNSKDTKLRWNILKRFAWMQKDKKLEHEHHQDMEIMFQGNKMITCPKSDQNHVSKYRITVIDTYLLENEH